MIRKHKLQLLFSSLVILLPLLFGAIVWEKLPEQLAIHWNVIGAANGFSGPLFIILFLPLFMLAVHWLCVLITAKTNPDQDPKMLTVALWMIPLLSLLVSTFFYASAFGYQISIGLFVSLTMGVLFIVMGNYLPKCRRNYTLGIKLVWTLSSDENWNATHRFSGKVFVAVGVLALFCGFLPLNALLIAQGTLLLLILLLPTVYSYRYYRRQVALGTIDRKQLRTSPNAKRSLAVLLPTLLATVVFCLVLCFTGDIGVEYHDTDFTVVASYHGDLTLAYSEIDTIEYREQGVPGKRISGFGSPRLLMGTFQNQEYGYYTRYTYTACEPCVVLTVDGKLLVLSGIDEQSTKEIYDTLLAKCGK